MAITYWLSFSRCLHHQPVPQTVQHYHVFTRGWLTGFGSKGKELVEQLDEHLEHQNFPEMFFFSIANVLANTAFLTCRKVGTVDHSGDWINASFSPDGSHLVTASRDYTAKIWLLECL